MGQWSELLMTIVVIGLLLGMGSCGLLAWASAFVVGLLRPDTRRGPVFWGAFPMLLVAFCRWYSSPFLDPPVNFEAEFTSPDATQRVVMQDITHAWTYDELGWRVRAKLTDLVTGEPLGETILRYWHSGFDDGAAMMPTRENFQVIWSRRDDSVLIGLAGEYVILPDGAIVQNLSDPEITNRFGENIPEENGPTP